MLLASDHRTLATDLAAALDALRRRARVEVSRTGVIGFCMGGFAAFLAAGRTDAQTFVCFYGGGIVHARPGIALTPLLDDATRITRPVLLLFGERDESIPPGDVAAIRERLTTLGKRHEIVVYPEAGHGFACDERASYHAPSAAAAWRQTFEWLHEHLSVPA